MFRSNRATLPMKKKAASPAASQEIHLRYRAFLREKEASRPMFPAMRQPRTSTAQQGSPEAQRKPSQGQKRLENSGYWLRRESP